MKKKSPAKRSVGFLGEELEEETLFRDVKEETGLMVTKHKYVNVYSKVFPERTGNRH
jgi:NADH pyrophosphatase NudC (nudix superfamily)